MPSLSSADNLTLPRADSSFLQQTLSNSYPRLLRLFHDFFTKISLHTETLYTQSYQSPETVLVLRSTANFEATYLARSSNRITEVVGQAVRTGSYPGATEGVGVARVMVNELDSSRFDPLLVRSVARSVVAGVELFMGRLDVMVGGVIFPRHNAEGCLCSPRLYEIVRPRRWWLVPPRRSNRRRTPSSCRRCIIAGCG